MAATDHDRPGPGFWASALVGAAVVAFGVRGLLVEEPRGAASAGRWLIGGALAVDLLLVPVGAAIGWAARRAVPPRAWPAVAGGLFASGVLVLLAAPLVLDLGGVPSNPSIRPRDYGTGLVVALGAVWAIVATMVLVGLRRGRSRPTTTAG